MVGKLRVKVIFSLPGVAVRLPLEARLELAFDRPEIAVEAVFERCCKIQLLGIRDFVRIVEDRSLESNAVALLLIMDGRLVGREGIVFVNLFPSVFEGKGGFSLQGCYPRFAQHPRKGCVGAQCVCP